MLKLHQLSELSSRLAALTETCLQVVSISLPELNMSRLAHNATITSEFAQEQKLHLRVPGLRSQ